MNCLENKYGLIWQNNTLFKGEGGWQGMLYLWRIQGSKIF
jgi:hypothetical protein